ncbi:27580_t:CDS:2, partial [Gigaspora margarita]
VVEHSIRNENASRLFKEFQPKDTTIPTLSNYPKDKLTSKLLNFKNLSEPINSKSAELSKIYEINWTKYFLSSSLQKHINGVQPGSNDSNDGRIIGHFTGALISNVIVFQSNTKMRVYQVSSHIL